MNSFFRQIATRSLSVALLMAGLFLSLPAPAQEALTVNAEAGNNTFSAVFDAPLGERINAVSSSVRCDLSYDDKTVKASGTCSVPLTSIMVDNEETKTEHFRDWVTNKKTKPEACRFEAKFDGVRLSEPLVPDKTAKFTADVPFTVCGRPRTDGRKEHVEGTALLIPGSEPKTIKIRAHISNFNRDAYQIGPKYTAGWLARVQSLAKVVAEEGTVDLTVFAKPNLQPRGGQ